MSSAGGRGTGEVFPQIAGYEIDAVLGRGTTGVVYRARQLSVDREVALKVLHHELVRNPRSVKRLQREARTAARLAHPNLISSIDMGETAGTWWFAMELVHGESLSARLERVGRLSERDALPIFIKLCEALQHASEKSVVHRDIKPANILLEEGDNPRLVDLGLARVEDDPMLTRTGATLGTPHYISPERLLVSGGDPLSHRLRAAAVHRQGHRGDPLRRALRSDPESGGAETRALQGTGPSASQVPLA
jgi:serine/threonine protein kinase